MEDFGRFCAAQTLGRRKCCNKARSWTPKGLAAYLKKNKKKLVYATKSKSKLKPDQELARHCQ